LKADDVARYLRENPVFFEKYADVLAGIHVPHPHGGRAIPLSDRQLLALREKNKALESRLAALESAAVVAIDRYGPELELDRRGLVRLERLRVSVGETLRAREERRKQRFEEGSIAPSDRGIDAVRIEEVFEVGDRTGVVEVRKGLESLGTEPRKILAAVGVTHFLLVDRRPGGDPPNALQALAKSGKAVFVIDPAQGSGPPREAFLPTEMDFAITGLWSVSSPGPWMTLYDLR